VCVCVCRWVRDDLERKAAGETHIISDDPVCYRPEYLKDIRVSEIPDDEYTCSHDYYDYFYEDEDDSHQHQPTDDDQRDTTDYDTDS